TAPTCASCRPCSATPTSRPRRSTPTCSTSGSKAWCATCIHWRRNRSGSPPCLTWGASRACFARLRGPLRGLMRSYLDFEKPVAELEAKVEELRALAETGDAVAIGDEIGRLEAKAHTALEELYAELTPWQKTQVARHPQRPHCLDYISALIADFVPFAGDRKFGDDEAIVGGFGRFRGDSICVIGHERGSTTESRLKHNFGMARPEGYRKAVRLMEMADRFAIPVLALVDTAGA